MKLSGNTLLITGGGSGIGRGLAAEFHARGNTVIIAGRRASVLEETAAAFPGMKTMVLDIEDGATIPAFTEKLLAAYPGLNGVLHIAGIMRNEDLTADPVSLVDAEATIATNLLGPIRLNAALLPHLIRQQQATILTVTSGLAFLPLALTPTYSASKAAIHAYSQALRYQLRETGVQVIELAPPYVQTELMGERQAKDPMAMPLADYLAETMQLLEAQPDAEEILVERVHRQRFAERNGEHATFFKMFNDMTYAARAAEVKAMKAR
ncbi:oxidoreductase [Azorhizobium oxalatiphilum]|uniref:Oxidoreductase n=1 Tax=Azorhizobium oxalatiphilum TaxID=980631 RepID=A0A917BNC5_9HYPH|nr:SDR family oxidoreductase [Azorhizobium oxalatiphilum]GGF47538.1 oxidoreductase [Azorhizobium oxalatiphilum]